MLVARVDPESEPRPSSPMAATVRPMTAPPEKAILSALAAPVSLAATVVRTFARVAVFMPMKPAAEEARQPMKKAIDCGPLKDLSWNRNRVAVPRITENRAMRMNSRFMKTIAPFWIFSEIRSARPPPALCFFDREKQVGGKAKAKDSGEGGQVRRHGFVEMKGRTLVIQSRSGK